LPSRAMRIAERNATRSSFTWRPSGHTGAEAIRAGDLQCAKACRAWTGSARKPAGAIFCCRGGPNSRAEASDLHGPVGRRDEGKLRKPRWPLVKSRAAESASNRPEVQKVRTSMFMLPAGAIPKDVRGGSLHVPGADVEWTDRTIRSDTAMQAEISPGGMVASTIRRRK